ncbi:MAG: lytic murein transglycosylase [Alphaproteobacteria bacterium]
MTFARICAAWTVCAALTLAAADARADPTFAQFIAGVRAEAMAAGIAQGTLDEAFAGITEPIARVIELDRSQPEVTMTFAEYMAKRVSDAMIHDGRAKLAANAHLLSMVEANYDVPKELLVALWGLESRFGEYQGDYSVIGALATLAYDGRRSEFFRTELLDALGILDEGHVRASLMLGSWAGAMGQNQFMPSSFRSYAVDFNGDGRRDIWGTLADVLASAANYMARAGWHLGEPWGMPVILPAGFDAARIGNREIEDVGTWRRLGVTPRAGRDFPPDATAAALVRPAGDNGMTYMVFRNYQAILRWNRSDYFAMSVVTLADLVAEPGSQP